MSSMPNSYSFVLLTSIQGRTMKYAGVALRITDNEVEEGFAAHGSCPDEIRRFKRMEL